MILRDQAMEKGNNEPGLTKWAEELLRNVGSKWSSVRKDYPEIDVLAAGWEVFYSPIGLRPTKLMIIGRNPGGNRDDFAESERERYCLPSKHGYFAKDKKDDFRLAAKTRDLFNSINLVSLLEESVKLNLLFFRSRSMSAKTSGDQQAWTAVPHKLREELETFSEKWVIEVIEKLKPRVILGEGIGTYRRLKNLLRSRGILVDDSQEFVHKPNRRVVYSRTENTCIMLLGILHLSGARPSKEELSNIRRYLTTDLSKPS